MNKVEVTSVSKYTGPYRIKINGQEIYWVSDIDINGLISYENGRSITLTILVEEFSIKTDE
jgi:hypothetical protein